MKFLILNGKGGVGKSTTATQILAPYIFERTNKACDLVEFDAFNQDSISYDKTKIFKAVCHSANMAKDIFPKYAFSDDNTIFDIGGNQSAGSVYNVLKNSVELLENIECVFIPLGDGVKDSENTLATYNAIKDLVPDMKFVFVLSKVYNPEMYEYQFFTFLGSAGNIGTIANGVIEDISKQDRNIVVMPYSDCISIARIGGLTAYEYADESIEKRQAQRLELINAGEKDKALLKFYQISNIRLCQNFKKEVLLPMFYQLDKILLRG